MLLVLSIIFIALIGPTQGQNETTHELDCPLKRSQKYGHIRMLPTENAQDSSFDIVMIVTHSIESLTGNLSFLQAPLLNYSELDRAIESEPVVVLTNVVPSGRLIFSYTGPINRDQDDVRRFADAAKKAMKRAIKAGARRPLLVRPEGGAFVTATLVASLAALEIIYTPLHIREAGKPSKVDLLGIWCSDITLANEEIAVIRAMETGRVVARDIANSDPERMAPPRVEAYLQEVFKGSVVKMTVISDVDTLNKDYPLLGAVNRAANAVKRHKGRLIYLQYVGSGNITQTLYVVGKGITFDTGGANIKRRMLGMSRDKSGAAAVAGFLKVLSLLKPKGLKVIGALAMVRNSIGEDSYVTDEVITSRAGVRVLVDNTDAEGRMVMADVLCKMKEKATQAVNPHLMTVATLTGSAMRAVGTGYTAVMDNGPASERNKSQMLQSAGHVYGDPFEICTIRREDYYSHRGRSENEDISQIGSHSERGHQGPAAFLIMASGLDKHGKDSKLPLPYTHMDIAGSAGWTPDRATGAPVVALSALYALGGR